MSVLADRSFAALRASACVLAAAALAALACDGGRAEPSRSSASPPLRRGETRIEPSLRALRVVRRNPRDGAIERLGLPLVAQLALAWDVSRRDIDLRVALPEGAFDVRARPTDGTRASAESMIREALARDFELSVRRESVRGPVLALRRLEGGLELARSRVETAQGVRERGHYRVDGAPVADLVRFLRELSADPIVDQTGLEGTYDFVLEWDVSSGQRALFAALADSGLELVRSEGEFTHLVVGAGS